ncbi:MAG: hypothetical protein FWD49_03880 [Firmicutes bacterium]|nr:hypothetical protein [Bacillota bacterium]
MRTYRYTPTHLPRAGGWGFLHGWVILCCAVGCTHGYAYPARFGAVTDISICWLAFSYSVPWVLPTVMHILPTSGQLWIYPYVSLLSATVCRGLHPRLCISCPLRGSYGYIHMLACFQLQCAVGFTHGYAYPAHCGAVTDISIYSPRGA